MKILVKNTMEILLNNEQAGVKELGSQMCNSRIFDVTGNYFRSGHSSVIALGKIWNTTGNTILEWVPDENNSGFGSG